VVELGYRRQWSTVLTKGIRKQGPQHQNTSPNGQCFISSTCTTQEDNQSSFPSSKWSFPMQNVTCTRLYRATMQQTYKRVQSPAFWERKSVVNCTLSVPSTNPLHCKPKHITTYSQRIIVLNDKEEDNEPATYGTSLVKYSFSSTL
jgi:hypothetical protein